jgi:anti-sigma factor RsiW
MSGPAGNGEQVLKQYLLGSLAPESREAVEKRLFSNDQIFWQHLCLAEEELIDAYVGEGLSSEEHHQFEQRFLCTADRREKLDLARALQAYAAEQEHTERQGFFQRLLHPMVVPGWAMAAAAAVLLIVLSGVSWQFGAASRAPVVVGAWVSAGLVRGAGGAVERVTIPPDCALVRLQLEPGTGDYDSYRATLYDVATGNEILAQSRLTTTTIDGRDGVTLTLPANLLPAGDYYVRLSGLSPGKDPAPLNRYDFRVLRPR